MLVDHAVVERTGIVIVGLATLDDRSAQALTQFALGFVTHDILLISRAGRWRYPAHPMGCKLADRSGSRITRSMEAAVVSVPDVVLCRRLDTAGWSDSQGGSRRAFAGRRRRLRCVARSRAVAECH